MHSFASAGRLAALIVLACAVLGGCKEEPPVAQKPATGFARALGRVGEGVSPSGAGFGWIDLGAKASAPASAAALGPGPADFIERPDLLRRVGIDLSRASAASAVITSYGLALRLDGAEAGRLPRLLRAAGASSRRTGAWTNYDLGGQWQGQLRGPLSALRDFGARVAISREAVILARSDPSRRALEDVGDSPLGAPLNAFAAACLGEVSSARTLLGSFTHNPAASPDLVAVGVRPQAPLREVLCAIGDSREQADGWTRALSQSFSPRARQPLTGEPNSRAVRQARVDSLERSGLYAARAEVTLADGQDPGFLYGALASGGALPLIGAPRPVPDGTKVKLGGSDPPR